MKLTFTACENAKPKEKTYRMSDGQGLFLEVRPNGSRYWRLAYRMHGKQKTLALGVYPEISLKEARERRRDARKLIEQGIDPSRHKQKQKRQAYINAQNTFKSVALEWHETKKSGWSESHATNVLHRMETDIFPFIGSEPIADLEAPDLLDVLRRVEKRGALDIAGRTRQICGQIFRYGIQTGRCNRDPSNDLKGALKTRKTEHFAAIETKEIPELLKALERNDARLYNRIQRMQEMGKAFPVSSTELARLFPELWPSRDAVKSYFKRRGGIKWVVSLIKYYISNDPLLMVEYRRPGQRGKASNAIVSAEEPDAQAALEKVIGGPVKIVNKIPIE